MLNGLLNYVPAIKYGNLVDNAEINPSLTQSTSISLTSAQILTLCTNPVQIVTTTTSGTAIVVESCFVEVLNTATTYTSGGAIIVAYNGSTATVAGAVSTLAVGAFNSTATGYYTLGQSTTASGALVVNANTGITIGMQTANPANGTGTIKATLNYYIVTL